MSVLHIVGPRRMLALVSHGEYIDGTDRQTVGRQTVTLRLPLGRRKVVIAVYHVT